MARLRREMPGFFTWGPSFKMMVFVRKRIKDTRTKSDKKWRRQTFREISTIDFKGKINQLRFEQPDFVYVRRKTSSLPQAHWGWDRGLRQNATEQSLFSGRWNYEIVLKKQLISPMTKLWRYASSPPRTRGEKQRRKTQTCGLAFVVHAFLNFTSPSPLHASMLCSHHDSCNVVPLDYKILNY